MKRYIAEDVTEAMEKIRAELGRDAFILNTRKIRRRGLVGFFRRPLVEVVAAYEPPAPPAKDPAPPVMEAGPAPNPPRAPRPSAPPETGGFRALGVQDVLTGGTVAIPHAAPAGKIGALEDKIDSLAATVGTLVGKLQTKNEYRQGYPPEIEPLVLSLLENEVHEEFAHKIGREVADIIKKRGENPREVMEQILREYLGEPAPIKLKRYQRTVVIMVGPTGVGKTTTIAKLAAIYALNHHARVGIITTDTYRIAAVEQLKTYAEILEVPITVVYAPDEMPDALRAHEQRDIVFIDTAGKSPGDPTLKEEVVALLRASDADEVHLVLSATTGFTGCLNIVNAYSFLRDFKLLFTKMDETPAWGMLLNLKFLTDRSFSYMAAGQTVPDDIEVMNTRKVVDRLMGNGE